MEMSDVSDTFTSQNIQENDHRVNESETNVSKDVIVTDEFWKTDRNIYELNQKIKDKEEELIIVYKMMLSSLDTTTDEEQKRDLKKAVKEKMDFLETRVHRGPKRQKLEEGIDNAGTKLPDQIQLFNDVTVLLVGSAGNGKSATGNSILGRQVFKTTASTTSHSSGTTIENGKVNNLEVKVVDGPGVDTDKSPEEILKTSIETIENALKLCEYRFSALLIVLKYGARFTKQESDFIKTIKGILGKNVIREFGVCIITHGDNFEIDNEDENLTFQEWCQQQEGQTKELFEECNQRCVLFNNRTQDSNLKELQRNQLLEVVSREKSYSKNEFAAAFKDMQKLIIETNAPKILEETHIFISKIKSKMAEIPLTADTNEQFISYKELLNDVNAFEHELLDNYGDPDNIKQSHLEIKVLRLEINNKLKTCLVMKTTEDNAKEGKDKVETLSITSWQHPSYQSADDDKDYVIVEKVSDPGYQATASSSVDSVIVLQSRDRKMSGGSQSRSLMKAHDFRGEDQTLRIAQIYERLQHYKKEIDNFKRYNSPLEDWKLLQSEFELKKEEWNMEMVKWDTTDQECLVEEMLIIMAMFSNFLPKSENFIWKFVKYVYYSFTT